jgi:Ca-activated chloride channel family protein
VAAACLLALAAPGVEPARAQESAPGGLRTVDVGGEPVEGSTDDTRPTPLTAGLWRDVLGPGGVAGDTHYFAYERAIADSSVHVAVTTSSDDPDGESLALEVTTLDGDDCGSDSDSGSAPVPQSLLGVGVTAGPGEAGDRDDPCAEAAELRFSVTHSSPGERAVAVRVVEEAPVVGDPEELPQPPESVALDLPSPASSPTDVEAGTAFAGAPLLEPGATVRDTVAQGEVVLYRVRLDWGQSLAVRVDVPVMDAAAEAALEFDRPAVALTLLDPFRQVVDEQADDADSAGSYDIDEPARLGDTTAPVAHLNRFAGLAATVPGDYWVSLAVQPGDPAEEPYDVPVEVTVDVAGEPGPAPTYPAVVVGPGGGGPGPEGYDAATPFLVGDGVLAATVSGEPAAAGADDTDSRTTRAVAGAVVGVLSLGCVAAGVALLRRRRTTS